MKKLDMNKPFVRVDSGESAYLLRECNALPSDPYKFLFFHTIGGIDQLFWADEYGRDPENEQKIKNAPQTLTFWVPVWHSRNGYIYLGSSVETQDKPTEFCGNPDFIKWAGPFPVTVE